MTRAVRNSTKAPLPQTAADFANFYIDGLINDPKSVELAGILDDVHTCNPAGDVAKSLTQFGDALQERLKTIVKERDEWQTPSAAIEDRYAVLSEHTNAAKAIVDSAHVLAMCDVQSLVSLRSDTLPDLLLHALTLIDMANNEADVMREIAIDALKEKEGVSHG